MHIGILSLRPGDLGGIRRHAFIFLFEPVPVVRGVSRRVIKHLRKAGRLSEDGEEVYIGNEASKDYGALSLIKRVTVSNQITLGLKVNRIGSGLPTG